MIACLAAWLSQGNSFFKEVLFKRFASLFASINIHCVCRILVPVKLMSTDTTPSWCPSKLNLGSSFSSFLQLCNHSQMIFLNSSLSAKIIVGIIILLLNENKLRRRKLDRFLEVWISCTLPLQYLPQCYFEVKKKLKYFNTHHLQHLTMSSTAPVMIFSIPSLSLVPQVTVQILSSCAN